MAASWLAMERIPTGTAADLLATDEQTFRHVYRNLDPTIWPRPSPRWILMAQMNHYLKGTNP